VVVFIDVVDSMFCMMLKVTRRTLMMRLMTMLRMNMGMK
jgi:hypothetical protein